jgi:hypothetical protein
MSGVSEGAIVALLVIAALCYIALTAKRSYKGLKALVGKDTPCSGCGCRPDTSKK